MNTIKDIAAQFINKNPEGSTVNRSQVIRHVMAQSSYSPGAIRGQMDNLLQTWIRIGFLSKAEGRGNYSLLKHIDKYKRINSKKSVMSGKEAIDLHECMRKIEQDFMDCKNGAYQITSDGIVIDYEVDGEQINIVGVFVNNSVSLKLKEDMQIYYNNLEI